MLQTGADPVTPSQRGGGGRMRPMLELVLLRHAKSRWDRPAADDHDRELAPRGERSASRMGRLLREEGLIPDLALCSTAVRARRTWELAEAGLGRGQVKVDYRRQLYLASPERLLALVRSLDDPGVGRLLLIGHNPDM